MPRRPADLPPELDGVFTRADAVAAGLRPGRLRRNDLDRSVHGVRGPILDLTDWRQRLRLFQHRLGPDVWFSHGTAGRLLGLPLPRRLLTDDVHVSVRAPRRAPHAEGLRGHSRQTFDGDVVETDGIRHSSPARIWCELSARLTLDELVIVGDRIVKAKEPLASVGDLAERAKAGDRITRNTTLRAALPLLDPRSESPQESRLRLLLGRYGIPATQINHTVVSSETGIRSRPDFAYPAERVVLEYQGDYHRTKEQWRADMTRRSRLEADGWRVMELNADDLRDPSELVARIRRVMRLPQP